MSGDSNQSYRRPVCQTTFFVELDNTNTNDKSPEKRSPPPPRKAVASGLWTIPFEDNESENENKAQPKKSRRSKRVSKGLDWVPLKENFVNTPDSLENVEFSVPQRLPLRLKKKLTPLKVTPRRRSSGTSSSLRRETFRITPRSSSHIKMLPKSITTTKKRRSGGSTPLIKTPRNRPLLDLSTPASNKTFTSLGVEEIQYISWLNVMLSSKGDDKSDKIDSNQLIIDCFNSEKIDPSLCPSKEKMSAEAYRESIKWNQLRNSALALYKSEPLTAINQKLFDNIRNEKFLIRKDRALHADIGYRKHISELLLSYNYLWLRIGLETVFQKKISTDSGGMRSTLLNFIEQNVLESKQLMNKYCPKAVKHYFKDELHISETKKYILAKFLLLVNFMDFAKQNRLIEHNPCLFRIKSKQKSTQEVIRSFASEFITGVGDIIKYLKVSVRFSMSYVQTQIEEFDFEVTNLAQDLKCGLRLTKLAELTTDSKNLLQSLLYPATNSTRKIHNLNVALKAFGDIVPHGITAQDIQKGHRTKTIKLLDAIIFKHRTDQILKEEKLVEECVLAVQNRFRANLLMKIERNRFQKLKYFTIILQKRFRDNKALRSERRERLRIEKSVRLIQTKFRANRLMKKERTRFEKLRQFSIVIQRRFRDNRLMIAEKNQFLALKQSTIFIQRQFKANKLMKAQRQRFQDLRNASFVIQSRFRANKLMIAEKSRYEELRYRTIAIQRRFRANRLMKNKRTEFLSLKRFMIFIQRQFRANRLMKNERQQYRDLRNASIVIQRQFRAKKLMVAQKSRYESLRYRTIAIQRRFRANRLMKNKRQQFQYLKQFTIFIQRRFRANQLMIAQRQQYQDLRNASIVIQRQFRANKQMIAEKSRYEELRHQTIAIQRRFRANRLMKIERTEFLSLERFTIFIQRQFRANRLMKNARQQFQSLKRFTIFIQRQFRANQLMVTQRQQYRDLRNASIVIQKHFRADRLMKNERQQFQSLKRFTIFIQRRFKANQIMIAQRQQYQDLRNASIVIQRQFRAKKLMVAQRSRYESLRYQTIAIQRRFRANRLMKIERNRFQKLKYFTIILQKRFRDNKALISERRERLRIEKSVRLIQTKFRANRLMKKERTRFEKLRQFSIVIQRRFRANRLMIAERSHFIALRHSAIVLQRCFRTRRLMTTDREYFEKLKHKTIVIQRRFRANRLMNIERQQFQSLKHYTIYIQRQFRANREQKKITTAAIKVQAFWRGYRTRKQIHELNQKVETAFRRIQSTAVLAIDENRLCNRTYNSLQRLLAYDQLLPLAHDLDSLNSTTSLLPDTCETIANAGAVPILLKILNEPNRSEPHKQIFLMTLDILLNLAKYDKTLPNLICNSKTIETLFTIIKKFNREIKLIEKSLPLLWILLRDDSIRQYVLKDKRKVATITQIYEHSKKDKSYKKYKLKSDYKFAPKWQIGKQNVYEFSNYFFAVQAIASRLNVL